MLDTIDSHYSVSNDDPRFHEEFYIGELDASGVPSEYPDATEPLEFEFVVEEPKFALRQAQGPQNGEVQELEELSDDVEELPKKSQPYFVMTKFGQNDEPVVELVGDGDTGNGSDTIIERNGVYSISDNLSYTNVFLNQEFKTLVDSVLQK